MLGRLWGPLVAAAHRPTGWDLERGIPRAWEVEETAGSTLGSLESGEQAQHAGRKEGVPFHGQRKVKS